MGATTLRIRRIDGDLLVIESAGFAHRLFKLPIVEGFERLAGTTPRDALTRRDLEILNSYMGARSPHALWEPIGRPRGWLQRIEPRLDLIRTSDRTWRKIDGDKLVSDATAACLGQGRNIGVATKMLHLKRPRLFPILDRFVVELLGAHVPNGDTQARAASATDLVLHLREQGRANVRPLSEIRERLRAAGVDVSLVRILDALLWSSHPAAARIASKRRVFRVNLAARPKASSEK